MKKSLSLFLAIVLSASFLAGCSSSSEPSESAQATASTPTASSGAAVEESSAGGGILNEATTSKIGSLNPYIYSLSAEAEVLGRTSMKLYDYFPSDDGTSFVLQGELAASNPVQVDEEGKVWQVKLNEGLKWENGDVITADDVIYSWQACLNPKLINKRASTLSSDFITIVNAENYYLQGGEGNAAVEWDAVGLKKIDDSTVEITTESMHNDIEVMMHFAHPALVLVHEATFESTMNEDGTENLYGTDIEKYMSCGQFFLEDWIRDVSFTYTKNPDYIYADKTQIAGISQKVVSDQSTQMQLFEKGEIDYIELSAQDTAKFEQDSRIMFAPSNSVVHMIINTVNEELPILDNLNFRKALYYGTDREGLAKLERSTPANYMVPTTHIIDTTTGTKFRDTETGKANIEPNYSYDPDMAVEYFNTALAEDGVDKVSLTITYADTETYKTRVEYLQEKWEQLFGEDKFEVSLQAMPSTQLTALRKTWREDPNCYQISWGAWSSADLAPWNAMKFWTSTHSSKNEPFFSDEFDAYFDQANYGDDRFEPGVREELTGAMESHLLDNVIMIPVVQGQSAYLKNDRLELTMKNWSNRVGFAWDFAKIVE